jgi:hypothetical protein
VGGDEAEGKLPPPSTTQQHILQHRMGKAGEGEQRHATTTPDSPHERLVVDNLEGS